MTTKKVCGEEEEVVPCFQPDSDVEICANDISPPEERANVTKELNRTGRPVRAASPGVGQHLVAARAAAASRACVEAGPRDAWTDGQRGALRQTATRRAMAVVQPYDHNEDVPQSATQPSPLTSASLLLPKFVVDFEKLLLRFLQRKDRKMSSLDRANRRKGRPKRAVKRKACPEQWDNGTTCPCGNDVRTGVTENWAQCDTCEAWIHDGCFGLEWAPDGPCIEQPDNRRQCAPCQPPSDPGDDSDADHAQPSMARTDGA